MMLDSWESRESRESQSLERYATLVKGERSKLLSELRSLNRKSTECLVNVVMSFVSMCALLGSILRHSVMPKKRGLAHAVASLTPKTAALTLLDFVCNAYCLFRLIKSSFAILVTFAFYSFFAALIDFLFESH